MYAGTIRSRRGRVHYFKLESTLVVRWTPGSVWAGEVNRRVGTRKKRRSKTKTTSNQRTFPKKSARGEPHGERATAQNIFGRK